MTRRTLTTKARVALFQAAGGLCHVCGLRIQAGEAWDVEHRVPLWQGGEDGGDNLAPAHRKLCHAGKSAGEATQRAKEARVQAAHIGAKAPPLRPMPGSRASGLRKRMDGTVERRA